MTRANRSVFVILALLSFFFQVRVLSAQERGASLGNPDVEVMKHSWSKDRVGWETDPFSGPIENFDEMRVRARNDRRIQDARKGPGSVEAGRVEREAATDQALISAIHKVQPARYGFTYKVSLQNKGAKEIVAIDYDYVFYDAISQEELGRREFRSEQKIAPGKTREIKYLIPTPPARRISVHALNKKERDGLAERIEIVGILYADGTSWERTTAKAP
jgi:hypothetical protein